MENKPTRIRSKPHIYFKKGYWKFSYYGLIAKDKTIKGAFERWTRQFPVFRNFMQRNGIDILETRGAQKRISNGKLNG